MPVSRWDRYSKKFPCLLSLRKQLETVYDMSHPRPRYKLRDPYSMSDWAAAQPIFDETDLSRLTYVVFRELTKEGT